MKTLLEIQITNSFTGGIGALENLLFKSGETPQTFWITCQVIMSIILMEIGDRVKQYQTEHSCEMAPNDLLVFTDNYEQCISWTDLTKVADEIEKRCKVILREHTNKN